MPLEKKFGVPVSNGMALGHIGMYHHHHRVPNLYMLTFQNFVFYMYLN